LIWLAELAQRPDADQLLAAAIELADEPVPNPPAGFATARWRRAAARATWCPERIPKTGPSRAKAK
jgi:hypothetical protein